MDSAQELRSDPAEAQTFREPSRRLPKCLVVVALNLLILGELTWSMYFSYGAGEDTAGVFLKSFLPMALGTLFLGRLLLRRLFPY